MLRSISSCLSVVAVLGVATLCTDTAWGQTRKGQAARRAAATSNSRLGPIQRSTGKNSVSAYRSDANSVKGALRRTSARRFNLPSTAKRLTFDGKFRERDRDGKLVAKALAGKVLGGSSTQLAERSASSGNSSENRLAGRRTSPTDIDAANRVPWLKRPEIGGLGIRDASGRGTFPGSRSLPAATFSHYSDRAGRLAKDVEGVAESIDEAAGILDAANDNASQLAPGSNSHDSHLQTMNPRDQIVDEWLPHDPEWLYGLAWAGTWPLRTGSGVAPLAESVVDAVVTGIPGKKDEAVEDAMDAFRDVFEEWLFEGPGWVAPHIMSPGFSLIPEPGAAESPWGDNPSKCIGKDQCGFCLKECPEFAIFVLDSNTQVQINWDLCTNCGKCVPVCPPQALYLFGQEMTVDEVLDEVEQDSSFYRESGGGITLSGGECLLQADFAAALLSGAHVRGINTAIETAFNVPWSHVEKVLPHVDVVLHDHKLTIPERHKKWTGVDNHRILENIKRAYETFPDKTFIARTPLIPGVNDDEEHVRAVLAFIR